jgi:hypothetical protein
MFASGQLPRLSSWTVPVYRRWPAGVEGIDSGLVDASPDRTVGAYVGAGHVRPAGRGIRFCPLLVRITDPEVRCRC